MHDDALIALEDAKGRRTGGSLGYDRLGRPTRVLLDQIPNSEITVRYESDGSFLGAKACCLSAYDYTILVSSIRPALVDVRVDTIDICEDEDTSGVLEKKVIVGPGCIVRLKCRRGFSERSNRAVYSLERLSQGIDDLVDGVSLGCGMDLIKGGDVQVDIKAALRRVRVYHWLGLGRWRDASLTRMRDRILVHQRARKIREDISDVLLDCIATVMKHGV